MSNPCVVFCLFVLFRFFNEMKRCISAQLEQKVTAEVMMCSLKVPSCECNNKQ